MGRKTFELPKTSNRTHIVISRQENYKPQGCFVVNSMEKAIEMCPRDEVSFIIGGGNIQIGDLIVRQNRTYISTS
jgi:dihydrofolate reductase